MTGERFLGGVAIPGFGCHARSRLADADGRGRCWWETAEARVGLLVAAADTRGGGLEHSEPWRGKENR